MSRFCFCLWARTAPTLVDPVDRAILRRPLTEQSCIRGPSELVLCWPEERGTAGFLNVMLHKKLDNGKSPPPPKKKRLCQWVIHHCQPLERDAYSVQALSCTEDYIGGWREVILCSDKYGTCTTSVLKILR
jgi:hypothetical protein